MIRALAVVTILMVGLTAGTAQAEPASVIPVHYSLTLSPHFDTVTLDGDETIRLQIRVPVSSITLNAVDLTILEASTVESPSSTANVNYDAAAQTVSLTFPNTLPEGEASIRLKYRARMGEHCCGMYLVRAGDRPYALAMSSARRVFPSFDDPAMKATFDVMAIVERGQQVLANGRLLSDTPGPAVTQHTLTFATTGRLSPYVFSLAVGQFDCHPAASGSTPLRVCGPPMDRSRATFALEASAAALRFFSEYFSTRYPFEKLDLVGLPDVPGAMEGAGNILVLDSTLFLEPDASADAKKNTAVAVAHEVAHQWLGDLATMQTEQDAWLSEGLATWASYKAVDRWHPEWNVALIRQARVQNVMAADATAAVRPIKSPGLTTPLAYDKAAAVVRMVERFVGTEPWRRAVNVYVAKFSWRNATSEDFWRATSAPLHRSVDLIFSSFITQPGIPLVTFTTHAVGESTELTLRQERFGDAQGGPQPTLWTLPVCYRYAGRRQCVILGERSRAVTLGGHGTLVTNDDAAGYFRSLVEGPTMVADVEGASPVERMQHVSDGWAAVRADREPLATFFAVAKRLAGEQNGNVLSVLATGFAYLRDSVADDADRAGLRDWVTRTFGTRLPRFDRQMRDDATQTALIQRLQSERDPKARIDATTDLARFGSAGQVARTWTFLMSGQLSNAEARNLRALLFANPDARSFAWIFLQRDWPQIEKLGLLTPGLLRDDLGYLCGDTFADEIRALFDRYPLPAPGRPIVEQTISTVRECAAQRHRLEPQLRAVLAGH